MKKTEYQWKSFDGLTYYAWSMQPETSPRAVVALVHGMGEHSGRYLEWATNLAGEGLAFVSFDYRGHGKSGGKKGDIPSFESLMKDIDQLIDASGTLFPGIPLVLYGHSLGGNLVINHSLRRPLANAFLVVTSPWLRLAFDPPRLTIVLVKLLKRMFPGLIQHSKLETKALSKDPEIVSRYETDPLVHDMISLRMFFHVLEGGLFALNNGDQLQVPTLLMHGESDRITSCEASRELARKNPGFVELKTWPGCYHELQNETCKDQVFEYLMNWLNKKLALA